MSSDSELCDLTAIEQTRMFRHREVSARELLDAHLARIDERNPTVNAIVAADPDVARRKAAELDERRASAITEAEVEALGPLAGLVTAFKDLSDTADFVTTYGSPPYAGHRPAADSLIVSRIKAAGAMAVGKTNVPEFGAGSHTFNPIYGTTVNPFDPTRSAGGSSGGAAAALACGMVGVADGSDSGGSLRNPAAWNNVVGFRPSAGVVPVGGIGNAWNPLPIHGPMGRTVDDMTLLLSVIAQPDSRDPMGRGLPSIRPSTHPVDHPLRVAWSTDLGGLPIGPAITETLARLIPVMTDDLGWSVTEDEPDFSGADDAYLTLRSFHYAGQAYRLVPHLDQVKEPVRVELEKGLALTATEIDGALAHLKVLWDRANGFFDNYDLLIAPVTQVMPFRADLEYPTEVAGRPMDRYVDWMSVCFRITAFGLPALSLPAGFHDGLPVGAQLIGRPHGDLDLLRAAKSLESALA
ncbi:MAG: amidase family protein [Acidimicrobiia bacterium]|nr:amidase family protein [Acidimicrobiia bacterium]